MEHSLDPVWRGLSAAWFTAAVLATIFIYGFWMEVSKPVETLFFIALTLVPALAAWATSRFKLGLGQWAVITFVLVSTILAILGSSYISIVKWSPILWSFLSSLAFLAFQIHRPIRGGDWLPLTVVLLSWDVSLGFDVYHYSAYVGPANRWWLGGGVPFVNLYSQYGMGPMVVTAWVAELGSGSYAVLSFFYSFLTLVLRLVFVLAWVRLWGRSLSSLFFAGGLVWLHSYGFGYNITQTPSVSGLRFLPSLLLVLALGTWGWRQRRNWVLGLTVSVAFAWSLEAFLATFAAAIVAPFALWRRGDIKVLDLMRSWGVAVFSPVLLAGFYSIFLKARGLEWEMLPYAEMLFTHLNNTESWQWVKPQPRGFWGWIPFAMILSGAASLLFLPWQGLSKGRAFLGGALLGALIVEAQYYVARPLPEHLLTLLFPTALLLAVFAPLVQAARPSRWVSFLFAASIVALWMVPFYKVRTPTTLDYVWRGSYAHSCFVKGECFAPFSKISAQLQEPDWGSGHSFDAELVKEAIGHFRSMSLGECVPLLSGAENAMVESMLRRPNCFPFSNNLNDSISQRASQKVAQKVADSISLGFHFLVENDHQRLTRLDRAILVILKSRGQLCVQRRLAKSTWVSIEPTSIPCLAYM